MDLQLGLWLFGGAFAAIVGSFVYANRVSHNCHQRCDALAAALADYKLMVAQNFASIMSVTAIETRLSDQYKRIEDKLDRLIEHNQRGDAK